MTQHDDLSYLGHMLETARSAVNSLVGISYQQFALAQRVQIVGEAARRVSQSTRDTLDLPWHEIIGMRHKIVHDYMGIDFDLVWQTAAEDLPKLIAALEEAIPHESPGDR